MTDTPDAPHVLDIEELRRPAIAAHRLTGLDGLRTFYYDETNNIRKLRLSDGALNVAEPACFALGGVVHAGAPRPIDLAPLRAAIRAQPSATELKYKHVAHGDFLTMLGSVRLGAYLSWVEAEGLLAHFSVLDPVFWSIVDIIDSVLLEATPQFLPFAPLLKTDLTVALRQDLNGAVRLFRQYDYPDVPSDRADAFLEALANIAETSRGLPAGNAAAVAQILRAGKGLDELPFIQGQKAGVLIETFRDFYLHRFYLFADASHILDTETEIIEQIDHLPLVRGNAPFRNFHFVARSQDEPGVQVSDILMGLLGHLFTWLRDTDANAVVAAKARLPDRAASNLRALAALLDRSTDNCPAFAHYVLSVREQEKAAAFLAP